jgi:hypothetical protein
MAGKFDSPNSTRQEIAARDDRKAAELRGFGSGIIAVLIILAGPIRASLARSKRR